MPHVEFEINWSSLENVFSTLVLQDAGYGFRPNFGNCFLVYQTMKQTAGAVRYLALMGPPGMDTSQFTETISVILNYIDFNY